MRYTERLALILPLALFAGPSAAQVREPVQWLSWSINATEVTGGTVWVATSKATKPDPYTKTWAAARLTPSWTRANFQVSCFMSCKPGSALLTEPLPNARVVLSPSSQVPGGTNVSVYWPVGTLPAPVTVASVASRTSAPALTMDAITTEQLVIPPATGTRTTAARLSTTTSGWSGLRYAWFAGDLTVLLASGAKLAESGTELKLIAPNGVVQKSWKASTAVVLLRPDNTVGVFQTLGLKMDTSWP
jgi:hypothetical protein